MVTIASIASKARPKPSNVLPRKASWRSPETIVRKQAVDAVRVRSPSKRPVRRSILRRVNAGKARSLSSIAFYAALRDTAHELGHELDLGFFAGSHLALADLSDVADAGRGGIFRQSGADHTVCRGG